MIATLLLLVAACSGSTGATTTTATLAPTSSTGPTTTTPFATTTVPTTGGPTTTAGATTTGPTTTTATTTTMPFTPPFVEANGWRLTVSEPRTGGSIPSTPTLCYEAIGTSREAVLALNVTLLAAGTSTVVAEARYEISVGRAGIELDLSTVDADVYDLEVGLEVDGVVTDDLILTLTDVTISGGAAPATCP